MQKLILSVIFVLSFTPHLLGQTLPDTHLNERRLKYNLFSDKLYEDTNKVVKGKDKVQKLSFGGLFLAPNIGVAFPVGAFTQYATVGPVFGIKLEFAYSKMYPFILGALWEGQKAIGNAEFVNLNLLEQFDTKISSVGGSLDILLNKFVRSDFTTPIFSIEIKYASINRYINPDISIPGISNTDNLVSYALSLGATLYVFDINAKYTFAQDYSSVSFQLRLHIPLIKF